MADNKLTWTAEYKQAIQAIEKINRYLERQKIVAKDTAVSISALEDGSQELVGTFTSLDGRIRQVTGTLIKAGNSFETVNVHVKDFTGNVKRVREASRLKLTGMINEITKVRGTVNTTSASWSAYQKAMLRVDKALEDSTLKYQVLRGVISAVEKGRPLKNRTEETVKMYDALERAVAAAKKLRDEMGKTKIVVPTISEDERRSIDKSLASLSKYEPNVAASSQEWQDYTKALTQVKTFLDTTTLSFRNLSTTMNAVSNTEPFTLTNEQAVQYHRLLIQLQKATKQLGLEEAKRAAQQAKLQVVDPGLSNIERSDLDKRIQQLAGVRDFQHATQFEMDAYTQALARVNTYLDKTVEGHQTLLDVIQRVKNAEPLDEYTKSTAELRHHLTMLIQATERLGDAHRKELGSLGLSMKDRQAIDDQVASLAKYDAALQANDREIVNYQTSLANIRKFLNETKAPVEELTQAFDALKRNKSLPEITVDGAKFHSLLVKLREATKQYGEEARSLSTGIQSASEAMDRAAERAQAAKDILSKAFDPSGATQWGTKEFFAGGKTEDILKLVDAGNKLIQMASKANISIDSLSQAMEKGLNLEIVDAGQEATKLNIAASKLVQRFAKLAVSSQMSTERFHSLRSSIRSTAEEMDAAERRANKFYVMVNNFRRLVWARVVTTVFYRLVESVTAALKVTSDLMIKMSEVQTLLPPVEQTASAYERLGVAIRRSSDALNLPQLDIAEGYYLTLSNQISNTIAETEYFIDVAAELAKVTSSTLPESIDALSSALNAYNYTVAESNRVSEDLFDMIDVGRLRLSDISGSLGNVTTVATELGISLSEITEALGIMTIRGIQPRVAMTLLRNIILKLQDPTEKMTEIFRALGVETGRQAIATFGLSGSIEQIINITGRGTKALRDAAGSSRALLGAVAQLVDGQDRFSASVATSEEKVDAYARALDVRLVNASENVNKQLNRFKNFFISDISEKIINLADGYNTSFNKMFDSTNSLSNTLLIFTKLIGAIGAGLSTFLAIRGVVFLFNALGKAVTHVSDSLKALHSLSKQKWFDSATISARAFGNVLTATAVSVTAGIVLYKAFTKDIKQVFADLSQTIDERLGARLNVTLRKMGDSVTKTRDQVSKQVQGLMRDISEPFKEATTRLEWIKFDEKIYGTIQEFMDNELRTQEQILSIYQRKNDELKTQIDRMNDVINRSYDMIRAARFDEEDFRFDRQTRHLNDFEKAWARINRTPAMKSEFLNLFEELKQDPKEYLATYDVVEDFYKRYEWNLRSAEADLHRAAEQEASYLEQLRNRERYEQGLEPIELFAEDIVDFRQFDRAFQQMFALGREMRSLKVKFEEEEQEELIKQQQAQNALVGEQKGLVNKLRSDIEAIEHCHKMIAGYQEFELGATVDKNEKIKEQLGLLNDIYRMYQGMDPFFDTLIGREVDKGRLEEWIRQLSGVREGLTSAGDRMDAAVTSRGAGQEAAATLAFNTAAALKKFEFALDTIESGVMKAISKTGPHTGPYEHQDTIKEKARAREFLYERISLIDEGREIIQNVKDIFKGFTEKDVSEYTEQDISQLKTLMESIAPLSELFQDFGESIDEAMQWAWSKKQRDIFDSSFGELTAVVVDSPEILERAFLSIDEFKKAQETLAGTALNVDATVNRVDREMGRAGDAAEGLANRFNNIVPSQQAEGFARGGLVNWKRMGTDTIPAMLTPGEFVVQAGVARQHRSFLEQLNAGHYNSGKPASFRRLAPMYMSQGGAVNINNNNTITLNSTGNNSFDAIVIGKALNREQRRGTLSLTGRKRLY